MLMLEVDSIFYTVLLEAPYLNIIENLETVAQYTLKNIFSRKIR